MRLASVRGYSHRYSGIPRQDDADVIAHQPSGTVLFAVADGVSAPASRTGGQHGVHVDDRDMKWTLEGITPSTCLTRCGDRQAAEGEAADMLRQDHPTPGAVEDLLATTLVAGYVAPGSRRSRRGDRPDRRFRRVGPGDGRYHPSWSGRTIRARKSSPRPYLPCPGSLSTWPPIGFRLYPDTALLVGTDGFGDPLGDGEGKIGQLFAEHLRTPPPARGLAHLLDFSRDTFDDDRALIAVWQDRQRHQRSRHDDGRPPYRLQQLRLSHELGGAGKASVIAVTAS